MKSCLAILALAALSTSAVAGSVTIEWTLATMNTDGTPIDATGDYALKETRIEYGTCNGDAFGEKQGEEHHAVPLQAATLTLPPGNYCFRLFSVNNANSDSPESAIAKKTVAMPQPCAPMVEGVPPPTKKPQPAPKPEPKKKAK